MRALPIVFLLALCAGVAHAQGGGSGTPPRREDPLQRKLQSVVQLEMIEAGLKRRPASATDGNTTLAQVREDFWRIQLANDDLNNVLLGPGLDVDVIKKPPPKSERGPNGSRRISHCRGPTKAPNFR